MPRSERYVAISPLSVSVRSCSGILNSAIMPRCLPAHRAECRTSANRLEQELQNLYMALGVCQCVAPRVEPVSTQEKSVSPRVSIERLADDTGQTRHVLIVVDYGNMLRVLMGRHTRQPLEHLESVDRHAISRARRRGENRAPN